MVTKKFIFIIGLLGFILGVGAAGFQSESKIQQIEESLQEYRLKIERCPGHVGAIPKNSRLKCGG